MTVSDAQEIVLIVLTIVSSLISITGSSLVLHVTRNSNDLKRSSPYHRLIAGMSIVDLIFSTSCILQMFLRPEYLNIPGAMGNFATCSFVGVFSVSGILANAIYSLLLSGNAYLLVCARWTETTVATWERKGHWVAAIVPLLLTIPGAAKKAINVPPLSSICIFFVYPQECFQNQDEIECTRGGDFYYPFAVTFTSIVLLCSIMSCVLTIKVYRIVRHTIQRSSQYDFEDQVLNHSDDQAPARPPSSSSLSSNKDDKISKRSSSSGQNELKLKLDLVRSQTIRFFFAYLNSVLWPLVMIIIGNLQEDVDKAYPIRVLSAFFSPSKEASTWLYFSSLRSTPGSVFDQSCR